MIFIYLLRDPRDNEIHYVGQTNSPRHRLYAHLCRQIWQQQLYGWILDLKKWELRPTMEILEKIPIHSIDDLGKASAAELKWIKHYRTLGCQLFNSNPLDHRFAHRLERRKIGKAITLTDDARQQKAWYRAAKRLGIKVSIRSMPDGMKLWRLT